jgi:hypothetical protein
VVGAGDGVGLEVDVEVVLGEPAAGRLGWLHIDVGVERAVSAAKACRQGPIDRSPVLTTTDWPVPLDHAQD